MLDLNKPVQTRDGRKARFLTKIHNEKYPLVFVITDRDGHEFISSHTEEGGLLSDMGPLKCLADIFNVPQFDIHKPFQTVGGFPARLVGPIIVNSGLGQKYGWIVAIRHDKNLPYETAYNFRESGEAQHHPSLSLVNI